MSLLRFFLSLFLLLSTSSFLEGVEKKQDKTKKVQVLKKPVRKKNPAAGPKSTSTRSTLSKTPIVPEIKKPIREKHQPSLPGVSLAPKKEATPGKPALASYAAKEGKLVVIDAGHGGYDLGAKMSSCDEKSLALSTALLTKKHLLELGYRVILTRSRDVFLSLERRAEIANQTKSKIFVSIHYNAARSLTAKGIEIYFCQSQDKHRSSASKNLASKVLKKMIDHTSTENRGVKEGNFFVIRETKMPAILVEAGFMTHPEELHLIKDIIYRDKIARGISEGIDAYFKS